MAVISSIATPSYIHPVRIAAGAIIATSTTIYCVGDVYRAKREEGDSNQPFHCISSRVGVCLFEVVTRLANATRNTYVI